MSGQIRRLERQLGAALFERRPRGMALTEAGRRLREAAGRAHAELSEAARGLSRAAEPEGLLALWASTTIASYVLPPLIAGFAAAHPRVRVRLFSANTAEVLDRVREGGAELGLVEGHGRAAGVSLPPFVEDELIAVADPSFAPRRGGAAALAERPILWRERGSGTRAVVERALRAAGVAPEREPRFELASTEAIKTAAIAGLGVAFLSRWSIRRELALGLLRPVPGRGLSVRRTFRWALAGGGLGGPARSFFDYASR
ncbi:MAG: LysR family transcriptional regulator, partial [Elusimicrobia bacterium]|nr:LysR family transcriptional regulator [Elusimicrobiota bacterium]